MSRFAYRLAAHIKVHTLRSSVSAVAVLPGFHLQAPQSVTCHVSQLVKVSAAGNANHQRHANPWYPFYVGAAAAAAAGGAAYLFSAHPLLNVNAAPSNAQAAGQPSAAAETAVTALLVTPLQAALQGTQVPQAELVQYCVDLAAEHGALQCWELAAGLWGLAHMLTPDPTTVPLQHKLTAALQQLLTAAQQRLPSMPLFPAILCAWALYVLDAADGRLWQQLMQRVAAADVRELDEPAQLYLLHAALQEASRTAAAAATSTTTTSSSSSSSSAAPRALLDEVEQLLAPLPRKMRTRVKAAYQDNIPLHPSVEGCYMPQLALLKLLPDLISTAKAAAAAHPGSVYADAFSGLSCADVAACATIVSDRGSLGRLKREAGFHWRNDQLLDRHQKALNQLVYVLQRQMGMTVVQPPDVDILLPVRRAVLFVSEDQQQGPSTAPGNSSSSSGNSRVSSCIQLVTMLLRTGFAAPPVSGSEAFSRHLQPGLAAAKRRCFQSRGWRCIDIPLSDVEGIIGQSRVTNHQRSVVEQNAALQVLLTQALQ